NADASGALAVSHAYTATGAYTATLTITDKDGGVGSKTVAVTVNVTALEPGIRGGTDLFVGGTTGSDAVVVNPGGSGTVQVLIGGQSFGGFSPTDHIVIYGGAGDDSIQVSGGVTLTTEIYGGAGNNVLKGGNGANIIVGGSG